tara:strand:- start:6 stop:4358 length:4353 start_codon:yes stop_codon:yes gene_type:complete
MAVTSGMKVGGGSAGITLGVAGLGSKQPDPVSASQEAERDREAAERIQEEAAVAVDELGFTFNPLVFESSDEFEATLRSLNAETPSRESRDKLARYVASFIAEQNADIFEDLGYDTEDFYDSLMRGDSLLRGRIPGFDQPTGADQIVRNLITDSEGNPLPEATIAGTAFRYAPQAIAARQAMVSTFPRIYGSLQGAGPVKRTVAAGLGALGAGTGAALLTDAAVSQAFGPEAPVLPTMTSAVKRNIGQTAVDAIMGLSLLRELPTKQTSVMASSIPRLLFPDRPQDFVGPDLPTGAKPFMQRGLSGLERMAIGVGQRYAAAPVRTMLSEVPSEAGVIAGAAVVPFFANPDDGLARLGFEVLGGVTGEATTSSTRGAYNLGNAMVNQIKRQVSKTAGGASLRAEDAFLRDLFTSLRFNDDLTDEQVRFAIEALENPPRDAAGNVIALSPAQLTQIPTFRDLDRTLSQIDETRFLEEKNAATLRFQEFLTNEIRATYQRNNPAQMVYLSDLLSLKFDDSIRDELDAGLTRVQEAAATVRRTDTEDLVQGTTQPGTVRSADQLGQAVLNVWSQTLAASRRRERAFYEKIPSNTLIDRYFNADGEPVELPNYIRVYDRLMQEAAPSGSPTQSERMAGAQSEFVARMGRPLSNFVEQSRAQITGTEPSEAVETLGRLREANTRARRALVGTASEGIVEDFLDKKNAQGVAYRDLPLQERVDLLNAEAEKLRQILGRGNRQMRIKTAQAYEAMANLLTGQNRAALFPTTRTGEPPSFPTVGELVSMRSAALNKAVALMDGANPDRAQARLFFKMVSAFDDDIDNMTEFAEDLPLDVRTPLATARAYSRSLNEIFTRSTLGLQINPTRHGVPTIFPEEIPYVFNRGANEFLNARTAEEFATLKRYIDENELLDPRFRGSIENLENPESLSEELIRFAADQNLYRINPNTNELEFDTASYTRFLEENSVVIDFLEGIGRNVREDLENPYRFEVLRLTYERQAELDRKNAYSKNSLLSFITPEQADRVSDGPTPGVVPREGTQDPTSIITEWIDNPQTTFANLNRTLSDINSAPLLNEITDADRAVDSPEEIISRIKSSIEGPTRTARGPVFGSASSREDNLIPSTPEGDPAPEGTYLSRSEAIARRRASAVGGLKTAIIEDALRFGNIEGSNPSFLKMHQRLFQPRPGMSGLSMADWMLENDLWTADIKSSFEQSLSEAVRLERNVRDGIPFNLDEADATYFASVIASLAGSSAAGKIYETFGGSASSIIAQSQGARAGREALARLLDTLPNVTKAQIAIELMNDPQKLAAAMRRFQELGEPGVTGVPKTRFSDDVRATFNYILDGTGDYLIYRGLQMLDAAAPSSPSVVRESAREIQELTREDDEAVAERVRSRNLPAPAPAPAPPAAAPAPTPTAPAPLASVDPGRYQMLFGPNDPNMDIVQQRSGQQSGIGSLFG